jgi:hypothetical protein
MPSIGTQTTTDEKYALTGECVIDPPHKGVDKVMDKPKGKMTCNRDEKIESEDWIVKDADMLRYEKECLSPSPTPVNGAPSPARYFMLRIYGDKGYIRFFGNKNVKAGLLAINWREYKNGPYINESLHKIWNIYLTLQKKRWCEVGIKGEQKPAEDDFRCQKIKSDGTRCFRSKCEGSTMCSQHFKLSLD